MRVIVCGGRDYSDAERFDALMDGFLREFDITRVIQGGANGADRLALRWAWRRGIPCENFPADWAAHGKAAGPIRNAQMLKEGRAEMVIAFPGGRGTADMIRQARAAGVEVVEALE